MRRAACALYEAVDVEGVANLPIIGDSVLFRAAFKLTRRDGDINNVYGGPVFNNNDNSELGKVHRQVNVGRPQMYGVELTAKF